MISKCPVPFPSPFLYTLMCFLVLITRSTRQGDRIAEFFRFLFIFIDILSLALSFRSWIRIFIKLWWLRCQIWHLIQTNSIKITCSVDYWFRIKFITSTLGGSYLKVEAAVESTLVLNFTCPVLFFS